MPWHPIGTSYHDHPIMTAYRDRIASVQDPSSKLTELKKNGPRNKITKKLSLFTDKRDFKRNDIKCLSYGIDRYVRRNCPVVRLKETKLKIHIMEIRKWPSQGTEVASNLNAPLKIFSDFWQLFLLYFLVSNTRFYFCQAN